MRPGGQAIVGEGAAACAESDDLGVGGGVVIAQDAVLAAGDDLAVEGDDGADGDFAVALGGAGFGDAGAEEVEVRRFENRSCGLLLGEAVEGAEAPDEVDGVDADDFAGGEAARR